MASDAEETLDSGATPLPEIGVTTMRLRASRLIRVYFIPGVIFQSTVIGGGYGTGREIIEYFTRFGALGGVLGMAVTILCWALVLGLTYEFARIFRVYDYRGFFKQLLGRGWIAFEVLFVLMFVLVLAVVGSATGEIVQQSFGIPYGVGLLVMLAGVGVLAFYGREVVTKVLAWWTVVLYGVFAFYLVLAWSRDGSGIAAQFAVATAEPGWLVSGFKYAMYNLFIVPVILFSARGIETRREAVGAAVIGALLCIIPGFLFHLTFLARYPEILTEEVPLYTNIAATGMSVLMVAYLIVLIGTFIETGAGLIQGVNERIEAVLAERKGGALSHSVRGLIAVVGIALSAGLGTLGIITLIARGYGTISWALFAVYVVPLLTVGVYRIARAGGDLPAAVPGPVACGAGSTVEASGSR